MRLVTCEVIFCRQYLSSLNEICPWYTEVLADFKLIRVVYIPKYEKIYNRINALMKTSDENRGFLLGTCAYYLGHLSLLIKDEEEARKHFQEALQLIKNADLLFAMSNECLGRLTGNNCLDYFNAAIDCYKKLGIADDRNKSDIQRCHFSK